MRSLAPWLESVGIKMVKATGYGARAACPYHEDSGRSFAVYTSGRFRCFSARCGMAGHLDELGKFFGTQAPRIVKEARAKPEWKEIPRWRLAPYRFAVPELGARGIPPAEVETWDVRWDHRPDYQALLIPIHGADAKIVSYSYRYNDARRYRHQRGFQKGHALYGIWRLEGEEAVLTEGFADCWKAWALGWPAVASLGAHLTAEQVELLVAKGVNRLSVMYDNDLAGYRGAVHVMEMAGRRLDVRFAMGYSGLWPKDPGEADLLTMGRMMRNEVDLGFVLGKAESRDARLRPWVDSDKLIIARGDAQRDNEGETSHVE